MRRRFVTVYVFTERAFGGNPLAVVLDAEGLAAPQMQALAREFNYAETSFVLPPRDPAHDAWVRIFTPGREIPFAGHPNIGTAYVLARQGVGDGRHLVFEEAAGLVAIDLARDQEVITGSELTAPRRLTRGGEMPVADLAACLSLTPLDVATTAHPPLVASVGLEFVIAELSERPALGRMQVNLAAFRRFLPRDGAGAVFAYVRGPSGVQARMFAPLGNICQRRLHSPQIGRLNVPQFSVAAVHL